MAEYYAVLSKAVAGLETNTGEARRAVYDKARNALIGQLRAIDPPLPTAEISRQRLELEEAIRRVERETSGAAPSATAGTTAPAQTPPSAPPPRSSGVAESAPASTNGPLSPQDVFRRAIQEAESRGAGHPPPLERAPGSGRVMAPDDGATGDDGDASRRAERGPPPAAPGDAAPGGYAENRRPGPEPRLAPDYDYEWEPEPPAHTVSLQEDPHLDRRDRPAKTRRGRASAGDPRLMERRARPSRLPTILLLVLIVAMAGGLAAFGWSQRAIIRDVLASWDAGDAASTPPARVVTTDAPDAAAAASNKNTDRLLPGEAGDGPVRVVDQDSPATDGGAAAGADTALLPPAPPALAPHDPGVDVDAIVAQKAILYEEPVGEAAAADGVVAIDAAVTWSFVADGAAGPEIAANIDVPDRNMKVRLTIRRNTDESLPASHLVEVVIDTPADFPGKGVRNVPRLVLKSSEEARGQPLIGASAKITSGFFWIALSGVQSDVTANMGMLRNRGWIDLPLVYQTGQRAILTIEKGTPGERVFNKALAAWAG